MPWISFAVNPYIPIVPIVQLYNVNLTLTIYSPIFYILYLIVLLYKICICVVFLCVVILKCVTVRVSCVGQICCFEPFE